MISSQRKVTFAITPVRWLTRAKLDVIAHRAAAKKGYRHGNQCEFMICQSAPAGLEHFLSSDPLTQLFIVFIGLRLLGCRFAALLMF